jgi:16S rRNA processing protein RimM
VPPLCATVSTSTSISLTDPRPDGLLEVGRLGRPHGVRGDIYIDLHSDRHERVAVGGRLYVRDRWLTISSSRVAPPRFVVHFDSIDDREAAAGYTGSYVYAEPLGELPGVWWVHELIGCRVVDQHGIERGACVSVLDNPAHDILELDSGFLVPMPFVTEVADGVVLIEAPDGLFD